jgi:hypothetical protein
MTDGLRGAQAREPVQVRTVQANVRRPSRRPSLAVTGACRDEEHRRPVSRGRTALPRERASIWDCQSAFSPTVAFRNSANCATLILISAIS